MAMTFINLQEARAAIKPPVAPIRQRNFDAAQINRIYSDFITGSRRIDDDLRIAGRRLRDRSRELVKNNKNASKFVALVLKNVLGCDGIKFQSKVMMQRARNGKQRPDEATNTIIQDAWTDWNKKQNASLDGELHWIDLQNLILRTLVTDGEVIVRKVMRPDLKYGFALQVLDTDQLNTERTDANKNIANGVEKDNDGRRVAYYLWDRHPDLPGRRELRIPANEILHIFLHQFPGQTRGIPWMAPVMAEMFKLNKYDEAELVAAQIAASQMGFWKQELPKEDIKDATYQGEGSEDKYTAGGQPIMAELGSYIMGGPNDSLQMFNPSHPVAAYEPFKRTCLQGISAGLDVAYMSLSGDVGAANFSSARVGLLDERATWELIQWWLVREVHGPVFSDGWLPNAFLKLTSLAGGDYTVYDKAEWHPRAFPWIDPEKDANAEKLRVDEGFTTRTRVLAAQGYDIEETYKELAREKELAKQYGLEFGEPKPPAKPDPQKPDKPAQGE